MSLQALYQVTTIQLVHDDTHEAPEQFTVQVQLIGFRRENVRRKNPAGETL